MNMMRDYETNDYDTIKGWWTEHTGGAPEEFMLSDDGIIIEGVAAAWLYLGNSSMAMVGWPVINPEAGKLTAMKALETILRELARLAKAYGCRVVFAYTADTAWLKLMDRMGFRTGDQLVTNMVLGV